MSILSLQMRPFSVLLQSLHVIVTFSTFLALLVVVSILFCIDRGDKRVHGYKVLSVQCHDILVAIQELSNSVYSILAYLRLNVVNIHMIQNLVGRIKPNKWRSKAHSKL